MFVFVHDLSERVGEGVSECAVNNNSSSPGVSSMTSYDKQGIC